MSGSVAQGAFARQYDRPDGRSDPRLDQYRCRSPRLEGPGQPGRERRRSTCSDRCPHPRGKDLIVSAFRKHSAQMKRVLSELSPEELRAFEVKIKKVGKRAAALMEQKG